MHVSTFLTPYFSVTQMCLAAIWLEHADGLPSLRGSTHRLNST